MCIVRCVCYISPPRTHRTCIADDHCVRVSGLSALASRSPRLAVCPHKSRLAHTADSKVATDVRRRPTTLNDWPSGPNNTRRPTGPEHLCSGDFGWLRLWRHRNIATTTITPFGSSQLRPSLIDRVSPHSQPYDPRVPLPHMFRLPIAISPISWASQAPCAAGSGLSALCC